MEPAAPAIDELLQETAARDSLPTPSATASSSGTSNRRCHSGIATEDFDEGCIALDNPKEARSFVDVLGKLRVWGRKNSDVERTALNEDQAFQEEVRNVARALGNAVKLSRAGRLENPSHDLLKPEPK
jgi:hypothetical protein